MTAPQLPAPDQALEQGVRDHYLGLQAPPAVLERLLEAQALALEHSQSSRWRRWMFPLATAALLLVGLLWWAMPQQSPRSNPHEVAVSVLTYHGYDRSPDHFDPSGLDLAHLNRGMDRIDFAIRLPERCQDLQLRGARYCQIAGHLAVHLSLWDATDKRHSLYVARSRKDLERLAPYATHIDDHRIEMWGEHGLFYALVSP